MIVLCVLVILSFFPIFASAPCTTYIVEGQTKKKQMKLQRLLMYVLPYWFFLNVLHNSNKTQQPMFFSQLACCDPVYGIGNLLLIA